MPPHSKFRIPYVITRAQASEWDDAKLKVGRDIFLLLPGKGQIKKNKRKQILCSPVGEGASFNKNPVF